MFRGGVGGGGERARGRGEALGDYFAFFRFWPNNYAEGTFDTEGNCSCLHACGSTGLCHAVAFGVILFILGCVFFNKFHFSLV